MSRFTDLSREEIYDQNPRLIRQNHFLDEGLSGLIARYNKGIFKMFSDHYGEKIEPWFFHGNRSGWEKLEETAVRAIRWIFEDYLQVPKNEIASYASQELFWKVGFSGILTRRDLGLNSSPYSALELAYPGVFSKEDFKVGREVKHIGKLKDFREIYKGSKRKHW